MSTSTPFSDMLDRLADTELNITRVEDIKRKARSLVEAQTMLESLAWVLQQQRKEIKRSLDERIEELKALKAAQAAKDKPAKDKKVI